MSFFVNRSWRLSKHLNIVYYFDIFMKHKQYTKEQYNKVFQLYNSGLKLKEIVKKTGINKATILGWLYCDVKPYCISEKWKKRCENIKDNLGKYVERHKIFPENLKVCEKAYLFGVAMTDGNTYNGFDMQVKDKDFADYVAGLLSKITTKDIISKYYERIRENRLLEKGYRVRVGSRELKEWLEKKTKNHIKIPYFVSGREKMWFFSGFFDSDGTIKYSGKRTGMYLSITQKNKNVLEQLQKLLESVNIKSSIGKDRQYFTMKIYNKKQFQNILYYGNFRIQRKKEKIIKYLLKRKGDVK